MPQIPKSRREPLNRRDVPIQEKGDLCYLITVELVIPLWRANPRWDTASKLRRMLVQEPDLVRLRSLSRGMPFEEAELINQAAMAYDEFYRRCVATYEDSKAKLNTDVYAGVPYAKSGIVVRGE